MKPTFKGHVSFLLLSIGVRMYKATDESEDIKLHMLHRGCGGQLGRGQMKCKKCLDPVTEEEIGKGLVYGEGDYLLIEKEDLEKIKLPTDSRIEILGFVEPAEVSPSHYEMPYFLGPDGPVAEKPFALLREVMRETGRIAIGKVVQRGKEQLVALTPEQNGILVLYVRPRHEIRNMAAVPGLTNVQISDKELKLGMALVKELETPFEEIDNTDRHLIEYQKLIEAKKQKKPYKVLETKAAAAPSDFMAQLEASLAASKKPVKSGKATKPLSLVKSKGAKKKKAA
jgi:DNA end-binding protein Ku